jgi:hypothetical protein
MPESKHDGEIIILPAYPPEVSETDPAAMMFRSAPNNVVKATNVYEKGVPIPRWDSPLPWGSPAGIKKEDILFICEHVNPQLCNQLESVLQDEKIYK